MASISITKTYDTGSVLTETDLDNIKDSVETFLNTTKISGDNIQTGGVPTASIADLAVTAAKLAADAVTTAKILDSNVTTAKIADSSVTTAKIADGNVTQVKRAALGQQLSATCSNFTTSAGSYVDVTNLTVTITTTGRPVFVGLVHDQSSNTGRLRSPLNAGQGVLYKIMRGSTDIAILAVGEGNGSQAVDAPLGALWTIDPVSANTYTYKVQMNAGFTASCSYAKLIAYEL